MQRYDKVQVDPGRAVKTPEGWIRDRPVLTRAGVFEYRRADGTIRREFRPPEEVFSEAHLASLRGVPLTTHENHNRLLRADEPSSVIGTVLGGERLDAESNDLAGEVVIYQPGRLGTRRELSLGYTIGRLEETPGEWNGHRYDCIQRDLSVNHCAVVPRGRAGNARLRLDAEDAAAPDFGDLEPPEADPEPQPQPKPSPNPQPQKDPATMSDKRAVTVRLDGGLEYEAAPEVAVALTKAQERIAQAEEKATAAQARADAADAERDALKIKHSLLEESLEQIRKEAAETARQRLILEGAAQKHDVALRADASDRDLMVEVLKKIRGTDFKTEGKSDDYVRVAFDIALEDARRADAAMAHQRAAVVGGTPVSAAAAGGAVPHVPGMATGQARKFRSAAEVRDAMRGGLI